MSGRMSEDEYMKGLVDTIARCGWAIQGVFPTQAEPGFTFAYTVGLSLQDLPELYVAGLGLETMQHLLNDVAQQMVDGKVTPGQLTPIPDVIVGYDVRLRGPIDSRAAEMFLAQNLLGGPDLLAYQVMWPDADGRFPFDPLYDLTLAQNQPSLIGA